MALVVCMYGKSYTQVCINIGGSFPGPSLWPGSETDTGIAAVWTSTSPMLGSGGPTPLTHKPQH